MARKRKRGRKKRKANPGWFQKGPDARRHVFTTSECRVGYWVTMMGLTPKTRDPDVRAWVHMKVAIHVRIKNKATDGPSHTLEVEDRAETEERAARCGEPCGDGDCVAAAYSDDDIPW